jgi:hypothetical protein
VQWRCRRCGSGFPRVVRPNLMPSSSIRLHLIECGAVMAAPLKETRARISHTARFRGLNEAGEERSRDAAQKGNFLKSATPFRKGQPRNRRPPERTCADNAALGTLPGNGADTRWLVAMRSVLVWSLTRRGVTAAIVVSKILVRKTISAVGSGSTTSSAVGTPGRDYQERG